MFSLDRDRDLWSIGEVVRKYKQAVIPMPRIYCIRHKSRSVLSTPDPYAVKFLKISVPFPPLAPVTPMTLHGGSGGMFDLRLILLEIGFLP